MSGPGEMWHIMRKDVRQSRWLLVAYLALLVAATLGAVTREALLDGNLQWAAAMLIVLGPVTAAILVQADSPTQADAFWASQPFRRSAMLGAKLVLVGLLFVLPLAGQLLALAAFKVPASALPRLILASVVSYGMLLLLAVFLGALTRDLKGFVLAAIGSVVLVIVTALLAAELQPPWHGVVRSVVQAVGLVSIVGLLVVLYLRRGLRRARSLGALALALLVVGMVGPVGGTAGRNTSVPATDSSGSARLTLELRDTTQFARNGRAQLRVRVINGVDGRHYRLTDAQVRFFAGNAPVLEAPLVNFLPNALATGPLTVPGIRTLKNDGYESPREFTDVIKELTAAERRVLARGVDSAQVVATMSVLEPRVLATLPLREEANTVTGGYAVTIVTVGLGSSSEALMLEVKALEGEREDYGWMDNDNGLQGIVVAPGRSEGLELLHAGASGNPGLLVLPGAGLHQGTLSLRVGDSRNSREPAPEITRASGAMLTLVHWMPIAGYRVQASSVPLPPLADRRFERPATSAPVRPLQAFKR